MHEYDKLSLTTQNHARDGHNVLQHVSMRCQAARHSSMGVCICVCWQSACACLRVAFCVCDERISMRPSRLLHPLASETFLCYLRYVGNRR